MKSLNTIVKTLLILAVMFFQTLTAPAQSEEKRPNILFAISDDQSFAHTSFAGCKFVNTPAFDRIASEGYLFQ